MLWRVPRTILWRAPTPLRPQTHTPAHVLARGLYGRSRLVNSVFRALYFRPCGTTWRQMLADAPVCVCECVCVCTYVCMRQMLADAPI
jgi:hypothetical protein